MAGNMERRVSRLEGSAQAREPQATGDTVTKEEVDAWIKKHFIDAPRFEPEPLENLSGEDLKRELEKCDRDEKIRPDDETYVRVIDDWRACVMEEFFRRQDVKMTPREGCAFVAEVRASNGGCSAEALLEALDRKVIAVQLEEPIPGPPN